MVHACVEQVNDNYYARCNGYHRYRERHFSVLLDVKSDKVIGA